MGFLAWLLQPAHPKPSGDQSLGCVRARLPPELAGQEDGLLVQVHYPAELDEHSGRRCCCKGRATAPANDDVSANARSFPWFRRDVIENIAKSYGVSPRLMAAHLADCRQLDGARKPKETKGWPIVLFTSGLFGCCEMYTQFCRELASAGAIVIAIEHEDGSQVFATTNAGTAIAYAKMPEDADVVSFRHPFLEKRVCELESCVAMILSASRGNCKGCGDPDQVLLAEVLKCGDPDRLLLCGHSFGCTGIVRYLRRLEEQCKSCPFKGALLLDLWGVPLTEEDKSRCLQIPCAFLLSDSFASGGAPAAKQIIGSSGQRCIGIASIKGTQHQWISESHYFFPKWFLRRMAIMGAANFQKAHSVTIKASRLALEAFLDPNLQPSFQERLLSIDQSAIAPV